MARSNFVTGFFVGKVKKGGFFRIFAASDLKLIELMKIYVSIEGQGHFLTLAQGHLHMEIKLAFLSNHWAIFSQIFNLSL